MPIHGFTPLLLCFFPVWILTPASSFPQHHPCRMIQRTALCNNAGLLSVPLGLPDDTEELQLNHNHIQTLANDSLLPYPLLTTLSLAGNRLETLESNAFQGSPLLERLNLAENNLHVGYEESSHALKKLPGLRALDLSDNMLEENVASVILQNLSSLEYLNLSKNLLLRLDESSFRDLHQLKELDLQRNLIFEIDRAFDSTPKLQRLNLAFNHLPCLIDFHMTQLVVLNVSHNSLEWFIARQDLDDTFHLETLDLTDNRLLFFPFLPSRSRLRNLYLSHNNLRFYEHLDNSSNWTTSVQFYNVKGNASNVTAQLWDESLHGDISSVEILDLRGNHVDYFPRGFIKKMPVLSRLRLYTNCLKALNLTSEQFSGSLYELDVSNNGLSEIVADEGTLKVLGNLTYFNLSLNELEWLPTALFSSLPSLRSVDLSYNDIDICQSEVAESSRDGISTCVVWKDVVSLRQLHLKGCKLGRIPPSAFAGMSLTHLELSDNPGLTVEHSLKTLRGTLQHLGLGNTEIQVFDFYPFQSLRSLNISRNSLTHLPISLLNLGLQLLDVRDNKLSTIPPGQANALAPKLRTVFVTGNPFSCCEMDWYKTFNRTKTVAMVGMSDILCQDLAKRTHQADSVQAFDCEDESEESIFWYLLLFIPISLCFVSFSIIFLLTFRPKLLPKSIKKKCFKPTSY
ncbi:transforming growth factor beta activator LRRC33 [Diretmus argenteus]